MLNTLILQLHDIGAIKFGAYTLKSGQISPIYIDLRETISYPSLMKGIADAMWNKISYCSFDCMCGVPYTALPLVSYLSVAHNIPMVMRRKEIKEYGTKKMIEGVFTPGQNCLVFEDLITSGASVMETIAPLEQVGLTIKDVVVFLDREQGGRANLESRGYKVHAIVTMTDILEILSSANRIDAATKEKVCSCLV